jgi:hypothetical protein
LSPAQNLTHLKGVEILLDLLCRLVEGCCFVGVPVEPTLFFVCSKETIGLLKEFGYRNTKIKIHAVAADGRADESVVHTGDQHINGYKLIAIFNILVHDILVMEAHVLFLRRDEHGLQIFSKIGNLSCVKVCWFFFVAGVV